MKVVGVILKMLLSGLRIVVWSISVMKIGL